MEWTYGSWIECHGTEDAGKAGLGIWETGTYRETLKKIEEVFLTFSVDKKAGIPVFQSRNSGNASTLFRDFGIEKKAEFHKLCAID
jgi:hypothetical protein